MAYVNGKPLHHVVAYSPDGFALGQGGADDLALSILGQIFQGACRNMYCHQDFKWAIITPATDKRNFKITSAEIEAWLAEQQ